MMYRRNVRMIRLSSLLVLGMLIFGAQEASSQVKASDAQEYIGYWKVSMEFGDMQLEFTSEDGKLGASLSSGEGDEPQPIEDISKFEDGLRLAFESDFGPAIIDISIQEGAIAGILHNPSGDFSTELTGVRESGPENEVGDEPARVRRTRPTATIERGERTIVVAYNELPIDGPDFGAVETTKVGEVLRFTMSNPLKLRTEEALKFGKTEIAVGNVADGYPGVYSLWLKRTESGWNLVFNEFADVWGTQHDPQADVAEVPLTYESASEPKEALLVELNERSDGGKLEVSWGTHRWSVRFDVVSPAG